MARTQITLRDTFNIWRTKSNEAFAAVGNLGALVATKEVSFSNPLYTNPETFVGTSAQITITKSDVYTINILDAGDGYNIGDEIFILGSELGGVDGINDCTITVDTVGTNGEMGDTTLVGTPQAELILEVNQIRDEVGTVGTLTTTAQTLYGAINELDNIQGNVTEWGTVAGTLTGAVKELKADIGSVTSGDLGTVASTVVTAISEIAGEVGDLTQISTAAGVDLGDNLVSAVNALKGQTDDLQAELGGDVATNYNGADTTVIGALNTLYSAGSIETLEDTFLRRDGAVTMNTGSELKLSDGGLAAKNDSTALVFKTRNDQNISTTRMSIAAITGNVGIGVDPSASYKVNVDGKLKATHLYYGTQDTDNRYMKLAAGGSQGLLDSNMSFTGNVDINPLTGTPAEIAANKTFTVHGETIADSTTGAEYTVSDFIRSTVKSYLTSSDITFAENPSTKTLGLTVDDDSHSHVTGDIDGLQEFIEDTVGGMIGTVVQGTVTNSSQQAGIQVAYVDNGTGQGFLNFDVDDFSVHFGRTKAEKDNVDGDGNPQPLLGDAGDVYGEFTISDLGDVEDIALTVRPERIQDIVGAFVHEGTGINVVYDDTQNKLTVSNSDVGSAQSIVKNFKFKTQEDGNITYFGIQPTSNNDGVGSVFNITRTGNTTTAVYSAELVNPGEDYRQNETLTVLGSLLGGTDVTDDLNITVTGLNNTEVVNNITLGAIATFGLVNPNNAAVFNPQDIATITAGSNADTITFLETDGIDIVVDSADKKVKMNVIREHIEDIVGSMFDNNFTQGLTVQYVDSRVTPTTERGKIQLSATGLSAGDIVLSGDVSGSLAQATSGVGYQITTTLNAGAVSVDEVKGFNEQVRDVVKNYIDVGTSSGLSKTVIDALDEKLFILDGDDVTDIDSTNGVGGIVRVTKVGSSYTAAVDVGGSGYAAGQRFTIVGTELDGAASTNDLLLTINSVNTSGAITGWTTSGVAATSTNTVDKLSLAVNATPTVTIGSGATVTVANSHITGTGDAGGNAFGLKINTGAVSANELATDAVTTNKIKNGNVTRSKTDAATSLSILNSAGTALKTIYGWNS